MQEQTIMEQPSIVEAEANVNEQIIEDKEGRTTSTNEGSFGKFKDATSLLSAYQNLEKEFTKKSQKLSELLKEKELYNEKQQNENNLKNSTITDNQLNNSLNLSSKKEDIIAQTQLESSLENNDQFNAQDYIDKSNPLYKTKSWRNEVSKFFEEIPEAKTYSKEISELLIKDKELAQSKNCLKYAYYSILQKKQVKPADLLNNQSYISSLIDNPEIKEKIIQNYLTSIKTGKNNLKFISGEPNNISPTPQKDKPKNLKEASQILKKILQA